jgi:HEAT repeat protein
MKRILPLTVGALVVLVALAAGAGLTVYFVVIPHFFPPPPPPPPFTAGELEDMQAKPDKVAAEISRIVDCFESDDVVIRIQAAETLKVVGAKAVDPVRAKLKSKNAEARFTAALTLAFIGPDARDAADDLLACLGDDSPAVRHKSVYALGKIGVKSPAVLDGLLKALEDKNEDVTTTASEALENFGAPGKEALPTLKRLAGKNAPPAARTPALKLLGKMGPDAIPAFRELLKTSDTLDTITIIQAVGPLGKDAKPMLPDLQAHMVKNRHWDAEDEMLGIFKKCGADGANGLTDVLKKLNAPDDGRTTSALKALGEIGPDAKVAVPYLIELLKERESLRLPVLQCLGDIGPAAKDAIPAVEALVQNPPRNDDPAVIALRRMGMMVKAPLKGP